MKNIINKIKKLFNKLFISKNVTNKKVVEEIYDQYQLEIFNQLVPGDMILCVMPLPKEQLYKIPINHRIRPYLVLKKNSSSFVGFYCSSNYQRYFKNRRCIVLNVEKYNMMHYEDHKPVRMSLQYIDLSREYTLKIDNIEDFMLTLDDEDVYKVNHAIKDKNDRKDINDHLIDNGRAIKEPKHYYKQVVFLQKNRRYKGNKKRKK